MLASTISQKDLPNSDLVRLPYLESIAVGTGAIPGLLAGYRYIYYTTPQTELLELYGLAANFANPLVTITLANMSQRGTWTPFFSTPTSAAFGFETQANPVLWFPLPQQIAPGSRIQIGLLNNDAANVSASIISVIGARLRKVV